MFGLRPFHQGIFLFASAFLFLVSGCTHPVCLDGNKQIVTQARQVKGSFNEISLSAGFTVYITPGATDSISVEAESNLLKNIITESKGERLEIRCSGSCVNPGKPIVINIVSRNLGNPSASNPGIREADSVPAGVFRLFNSGSGTIKADVHTRLLEVSISGSGSMEIWGKTEDNAFSVSGSGNIDAYGLIQDRCRATLSGSGSMYINVKTALDANLSGSGSLHYKGNPELTKKVSGSGSIISVNLHANQNYQSSGGSNTFLSKSMFFIY